MAGMSIRQANERDAAAAAAALNPTAASKRKIVYAAVIVAIVAVAFGSYTYMNSPGPKRSREGRQKPFFADKPPPIDAPAGALQPQTHTKSKP